MSISNSLFGFILSLAALSLFPSWVDLAGAAIIFFSSFLIDFDHYLYYIYKNRNFDPVRAYNWFRKKGEELFKLPKEERKKYFVAPYIFHGLEWVLLFILLGLFVSSYFIFIAVGMVIHLVLDWIAALKEYGRFLKFSVIVDLVNERSLKQI